MHTLSGVIGILLNLCVGTLSLRSLRSIQDWSQRRIVQLLILGMPGITLGLGLVCLYHLVDHLCTGIPLWDTVLGTLFPGIMLVITSIALLIGMARHVLLSFFLSRTQKIMPPHLQQVGGALAHRFHIASPPIFCTPLDRPLVFTCGFRRPIILLSSWMLQQLDQQELEAVLAHEIGHIAHHDYLLTSLATILRDAFFYLPPIRFAYHQIQQEKEVRGDERAIRITQRPLALASALTKVWLHTVDGPSPSAFTGGQHLVTDHTEIRSRIERLLRSDAHERRCYHVSLSQTFLFPCAGLVFFLIISLLQIVVFCSLMVMFHCFPPLFSGRGF